MDVGAGQLQLLIDTLQKGNVQLGNIAKSIKENPHAPVLDPVFKGDPQAPNPPPGDNDNSIATTQWVTDAITSSGGSGYVLPIASTTILGGVKIDGTTITISGSGVISAAGGTAGVSSFNTRTGAVTLTTADVTGVGGLTGNQTISLSGDVTGSGATSIATTLANTAVTAGSYTYASVTVDAKGRITAASSGTAPVAPPGPATVAPLMDGTAAVGTSLLYARQDHVHGTDTSRYAASNPSGYQTAAQVTSALAPYAPLASPAFTGTPSLPTGTTGITQTAGTSNTSLATTAFVAAAVSGGVSGYLPLTGGALSGALTITATPAPLTLKDNSTTNRAWWNNSAIMPASPLFGTAAFLSGVVGGFGVMDQVAAPTAMFQAGVAANSVIVRTIGVGYGNGGFYAQYQARGTWAAPTVSLQNDSLMYLTALGFDGAAYREGCRIQGQVIDAAPSSTSFRSQLSFMCVLTGTIGVVALATLNDANLTLRAGTGLVFGSITASSTTDLSEHISLWGTTFGFCVTSGQLNIVSGGAAILQLTSSATISPGYFSGTIYIATSSAPAYSFRPVGGTQPTDAKNWDLFEDSATGNLMFRALNDAYSASAAVVTWTRNTSYTNVTMAIGVPLTANAGLNFGSTFASSTSDLSNHIALYGTQWGFNVTSGQLNIVTGGNNIAWFGTGALNLLSANLTLVSATANNMNTINQNNSTNYNAFVFQKYRGTSGSGAAVQLNDTLGGVQWYGYTGAGVTPGAAFNCSVIETTPSATAMGSKIALSVTPVGAAAVSPIQTWDFTNGVRFGTTLVACDLATSGRTGSVELSIAKSGSGQANWFSGYTGTAATAANLRWRQIMGNATAEATNNVGSDFYLQNYSNSGGNLGTPLYIERASGWIYINGSGATAAGASGATSGSPLAVLRLNKTGSTASSLVQGMNNGLARWSLAMGDTTAEGGSNAGSNLTITGFADNGSTTINNPLVITRSSGVCTFAVAIVNGPSDRTLKENIEPIDDALYKVKQLQGVTFNRIGDESKKREIGLIAQDVAPIVPEIIQEYMTEDEPKLALDYPKLTALLIEAVKSLAGRVAALEAA